MINKFEFNIVKNQQRRTVKVEQKIDAKKSQLDYETALRLIACFDASK